ncbi:hypothetical protein LTR16_008097, partial [Cryomyces antarcticus]
AGTAGAELDRARQARQDQRSQTRPTVQDLDMAATAGEPRRQAHILHGARAQRHARVPQGADVDAVRVAADRAGIDGVQLARDHGQQAGGAGHPVARPVGRVRHRQARDQERRARVDRQADAGLPARAARAARRQAAAHRGGRGPQRPARAARRQEHPHQHGRDRAQGRRVRVGRWRLLGALGPHHLRHLGPGRRARRHQRRGQPPLLGHDHHRQPHRAQPDVDPGNAAENRRVAAQDRAQVHHLPARPLLLPAAR